jgi:hypothetical protein
MSTKLDTIKKTRDVVHDIFFEASKHITNDEYWKSFFIDLSKNKLARKIHIDGRHISHNSKRAKFSYCYEGKSAEEVAIELRKIINNTMCIYSDVDMTNEQEGLATIVGEFKDAKTEDDWKKVKNKKMKDHLITHFVLAQKELHDMSWEQSKRVYETINNALYLFRTHKSQDIVMENGNIESIEDIIINKDNVINNRWKVLVETEDTKLPKKKLNLDKEWSRVCNAIAKKARVLLCDENDDELGIKKKPSRAVKKVTTSKPETTQCTTKRKGGKKKAEQPEELPQQQEEPQEVDEVVDDAVDEVEVEEDVEDDQDNPDEQIDEDDTAAVPNEDCDDDESADDE